MISCIMPTGGRPHFAPLALESFLSQEFADRELIIIDDADNPSFRVPPDHPMVNYSRIRGVKLGAKRNLAVQIAKGDVIAHFDDDDHSEIGRLTDQFNRLVETNAQVTGYRSMRFLDVSTGQWWMYSNKWTWFALGTSLMYRRAFWARHRFPILTMGEDTIFIDKARRENALVSVDANGRMWARKHPGNTAPKAMRGSFWTPEREAA